MESVRMPAEIFAPGEFIREELEARSWTQDDLAKILSRPKKTVNQIITGKKQITPETAVELSQAFGTSPELWLNLESTYRLSLGPKRKEAIARRSRIYSLVPVSELITRSWITTDSARDLDTLEREVCNFLLIKSLDEQPSISFAARVSTVGISNVSSQIAWASRVKALAEQMSVRPYSSRKLRAASPALRRYSATQNSVIELPKILSEFGVRLVYVPHLSRTKIDGAAFWLEGTLPVVAISLRYDRIDYFWFTLMHELAHIACRHGNRSDYIDNSLVGRDRKDVTNNQPQDEEADLLASEWLIRKDELEEFIGANLQYFSRPRIIAFASKIGVHPGIVVGRLQHLGYVPWSHFRNLLTKVKPSILSCGLMDAVCPDLVKAN